jgi:hypothetical protein
VDYWHPGFHHLDCCSVAADLIRTRLKGNRKMTTTRLQELEEMGLKLQASARKLPPGPERDSLLQDVGKFRAQIVAMRNHNSRSQPDN